VKRWLAAATLFLIAALSIVGLGTTTISAATYTYDAPSVTRADVHEIDVVDASSRQLGDTREGLAGLSLLVPRDRV
jgi:hypothetical protein